LGVFGEVFGREFGGVNAVAAEAAELFVVVFDVLLWLEDDRSTCNFDEDNSCSCRFMSVSNSDREQLNKFISSSFSTSTFEIDENDVFVDVVSKRDSVFDCIVFVICIMNRRWFVLVLSLLSATDEKSADRCMNRIQA
jgi:hypothetical protein